MTDTNAESHEHSITRIFPRIAETGTTREVLKLLDRFPAMTAPECGIASATA